MFPRDARINTSCCRQMKAIRTVEKTGSISVALTDGMPKKENGEGSIYKCIMTKILQQGTLNRCYYTYVSFVEGGGGFGVRLFEQ